MSVNQLDFNQVATLLNDIYEQASGNKELAPVNEAEWVSVAQKTLACGYEPVMNAITQVLGKTIFSIRPYNRKFKGLQVDEQIWGYITRKIVLADKPFEDDDRFNLVDGEAIDHYVVNKPNPLQLNYYGQNIFQKEITIFKDQLDSAMQSSAQFGSFLAMLTQNASDMIEKAHEELARGCIANFIGGRVAEGEHVIHLLTEYNELTGLSLDAQTCYQPENFKPFMQWVFSRVEDISSRMTERSSIYQTKVEGYEINRHTPREAQRVYLYAPLKAQIDAMVKADTYHDNYLSLTDTESVNFWQSIEDPYKINVAPVRLDTNGELVEEEAMTVDKVVGVIFDRDAMGYTVMSTWSGVTPLNVRGGYWNQFYHFTDRYWNDFTEKGVVLLLD